MSIIKKIKINIKTNPNHELILSSVLASISNLNDINSNDTMSVISSPVSQDQEILY